MVNGQSKAFAYICDSLDDSFLVIDSTRSKFKVFSLLYLLTKVIMSVLLQVPDKIYLSGIRTIGGYIQEAPIRFVARVFKIEFLYHLHGADLQDLRKKISRFGIRKSYYSVSKFLILHDSFRSQIPEKSEYLVVNNFYSVDINEPRESFKRILFLSNLTISKGADIFLEVVEAILAEQKNYVFNLAGPLIDNELLRPKVIELESRFPDSFIYHGPVNGQDLENLYASSDVFMFPSRYKTEAFPLVLLDAWAAGMYVICSTVNKLKTIAEDFSWCTVESEGIADWKEAVLGATNVKRITQRNLNEYSRTHHLNALKKVLQT